MAGERGSAGIIDIPPAEAITAVGDGDGDDFVAVGVQEAELYANEPPTETAQAASVGAKREELTWGRGYEMRTLLGGGALFGEQRGIISPNRLIPVAMPVRMGVMAMNVLAGHRRRR